MISFYALTWWEKETFNLSSSLSLKFVELLLFKWNLRKALHLLWNLTIENDATNFISYGDWIENSLDIFSIVDNYRRSFWCNQNIFEKWKM